MLQDPISKPPDVQMEGARAGTDRRNKPNNGTPEQVLKCPRCDSLNTKFCYYNNYSLTQPRHFCKNCRRYWTQGGSLRNVPIGGGCRKNKRVKQRTVDPHMFGGLDDHGFLQHAGGSAGGLLSSSCFGGAGGSGSVPGFGDLMPSNDSHLLSMAFSRLQESLRLGEHTGAAANNPAGKLSLMGHISPLYDTGAGLISNYSDSNVKPEHVYNNVNGSSSDQLGCNLFDPSSTSHLGSATASLASLEDQITDFGVQNMADAFNSCSLEAQLKLQHQKQLALHLGAASDHHNMSINPTNTSSSNGGSSVVENGRAYPHAAAHHHHHHHHHHALPDFEDHESPESMGNMMMRRGHAAGKGKVMNMGIDGRGLVESWQQAGGAVHEGNMNVNMQQSQHQHGGSVQQTNLYHEPVISTSSAHAVAGDQQMSFWSQSPWADHHVHTQLNDGSTAGALL